MGWLVFLEGLTKLGYHIMVQRNDDGDWQIDIFTGLDDHVQYISFDGSMYEDVVLEHLKLWLRQHSTP